tara:strand:+ start:37 stop:159 length:123 start_codon:yes stop_codon:yes gene_type:complete
MEELIQQLRVLGILYAEGHLTSEEYYEQKLIISDKAWSKS